MRRPLPESVTCTEATVDVVLVTYNSAGCLPGSLAALRSFMAGEDYRLIVVDNASSDASVATVRELEPDAVIIANDTNVGFASAVNQAVAAGRGDVVLLVNPDIRSVAGTFESIRAVFTSAEGVGAVATRMVDETGALQRTCHAWPTPFTMLSENLALHERFPGWDAARAYRMLDWAMDDVREVEDACGGFLALRREALQDVGPLDERFFLYCEETDWLLRARERSWTTVFTPDVEVVHAAGGSSDESSETMSAFLLESQYKYLRKRFGPMGEWRTRMAFLALDLIRSLGFLSPSKARRCSGKAAWRRVPLHLGRTR